MCKWTEFLLRNRASEIGLFNTFTFLLQASIIFSSRTAPDLTFLFLLVLSHLWNCLSQSSVLPLELKFDSKLGQ